MKRIIIAIDGPSASGKGTLARNLAKTLSYEYLDTGALYRAVAKAVLDAGGDPENEEDAAQAALSFSQNFNPTNLQDPALRQENVAQGASIVAKFPSVRNYLLQFQKDFAAQKGVVMDGRDIGTVVAPDAEVKFFVTASIEERTRRRFEELKAKGENVTYDAILADMKVRDARDSGRDFRPLKPADDAIFLDTSVMSADEVMTRALTIIHDRAGF